ncbi:MAG TPA: hypothetical protein DD423_02535 [Opitutae bacterium]|nr:hypothetical protein [Opitutae bacterium]
MPFRKIACQRAGDGSGFSWSRFFGLLDRLDNRCHLPASDDYLSEASSLYAYALQRSKCGA